MVANDGAVAALQLVVDLVVRHAGKETCLPGTLGPLAILPAPCDRFDDHLSFVCQGSSPLR